MIMIIASNDNSKYCKNIGMQKLTIEIMLKWLLLRADFRQKTGTKWKCFCFVRNDWGINPAGVGWLARQHHGLLKLSGRQFFSNFENSKLIGVVLRADFRQKPGPKWKLATSRGYSSQTGGLREKSFQILNHLSWVNNVYILVWIRALSL